MRTVRGAVNTCTEDTPLVPAHVWVWNCRQQWVTLAVHTGLCSATSVRLLWVSPVPPGLWALAAEGDLLGMSVCRFGDFTGFLKPILGLLIQMNLQMNQEPAPAAVLKAASRSACCCLPLCSLPIFHSFSPPTLWSCRVSLLSLLHLLLAHRSLPAGATGLCSPFSSPPLMLQESRAQHRQRPAPAACVPCSCCLCKWGTACEEAGSCVCPAMLAGVPAPPVYFQLRLCFCKLCLDTTSAVPLLNLPCPFLSHWQIWIIAQKCYWEVFFFTVLCCWW